MKDFTLIGLLMKFIVIYQINFIPIFYFIYLFQNLSKEKYLFKDNCQITNRTQLFDVKVLLIFSECYSWGQIEKYALQLAKGMQQRNILVIPLIPTKSLLKSHFEKENISYIQCDFEIEFEKTLTSIINDFKIDIIHSQKTHEYRAASRAAQFTGALHILQYHGNMLEALDDIRDCEASISTSPGFYHALQQHNQSHKLGIKRIELINALIDESKFTNFAPPTSREAFIREALKLSLGDAPVILMLGNFFQANNHQVIPEVLYHLRFKFNTEINLVLAGDDMGKLGPLIRAAAELEVDDMLHYVGFERRMPELIAHADALLLPSLAEAFGQTPLQAAWLGTPVIVTQNAGVSGTLFVENETGFLVDPKDPTQIAKQIARVVNNLEGAREVARRAKARVEMEFSNDVMLEKTASLYRDVLGRKADVKTNKRENESPATNKSDVYFRTNKMMDERKQADGNNQDEEEDMTNTSNDSNIRQNFSEQNYQFKDFDQALNKAKDVDVKVLLIFSECYSWGGVEEHALKLAKGMQQRNILVIPLIPTKSMLKSHFEKENISYIQCDFEIEFEKTLTSIINDFKIDIIHSQKTHEYRAASRVAQVTGALHILQYHGNMLEALNDIRDCEASISTSPGFYHALQQHNQSHKLGIKRIELIHALIDELKFTNFAPPTSKEAFFREALKLSLSDAPVILILGNFFQANNHQVIPEVLYHLRFKFNTEISLVLAGDDMGKLGPLIRASAELEVDDMLHYVGFERRTPELIAHADALLLPSLAEAFGQTPLQAAWLGTPVIVTQNAGVSGTLFVENETGFLVDPKDPTQIAKQIARVVNNLEGAREVAMRAKARVEMEFSNEVMLEKTASLYRDIMERKTNKRDNQNVAQYESATHFGSCQANTIKIGGRKNDKIEKVTYVAPIASDHNKLHIQADKIIKICGKYNVDFIILLTKNDDDQMNCRKLMDLFVNERIRCVNESEANQFFLELKQKEIEIIFQMENNEWIYATNGKEIRVFHE